MEMLAEATGLKKASLYHRFPNGKQQMAEEVLASAFRWYQSEVIDILRGPGPPADRVATVARNLDQFYGGGLRACLLNMLTAPRDRDGPFSAPIKGAFQMLIDAFSVVGRDAGLSETCARLRAERAVMLLHGSLVLARGLGENAPFQAMLAALPHDLLGSSPGVAP